MGDIWDSLEADYGTESAATPDLFAPKAGADPDVWDSLESDYGVEPVGYGSAALSLVSEIPGNIWSGIKKAPGAIYDAVASIPDGASNLLHFPGDALTAAVDATSQGYSALSGDPYVPAGLSLTDNKIIKKVLSGESLTPEELLRKEAIKNTLLPEAAAGSAEQYARGERTARGVALLGSTIAGGGTGLGPVVGGAAGITGLNQLNQVVGNDAPSDALKDLKDFEESLGTFGAISGGSKAIIGAAKAAPKIAKSLDRKSIGTRQSDYGSSSELGTIVDPATGDLGTYVKATLDNLLEKNKLGKSRDPGKLMEVVDKSSKELGSKIDTIIQGFDESGATAPHPEFTNALKYIAEGKIPANEVPSYIKRLEALDRGIAEQGGGKLAYLQQQKIATGKNYSTVDAVKAGFEREIYKDLQTTIEKVAPEVGPLNAELAQFITVRPIVARSLKASENRSPLNQIADVVYTTTGVGAPAIVGSILGGPVGTAIGVGAGLAGKALKSPKGQATVARILRTPEKATKAVKSLFSPKSEIKPTSATNRADIDIPKLTTPAASLLAKEDEKNSTGMFPQSDEDFQSGGIFELEEEPSMVDDAKQTVQYVEEQIDKDPYFSTLYEFESNRNPSAKNKESTASGGFQFIKSTAKSMGLDDPFDLGKSYEAVQKLDNQSVELHENDPILRYSAHYLGETVLRKVLNGQPLKEKEQEQVKYLRETLIPRFEKMYAKNTKKIASKVGETV